MDFPPWAPKSQNNSSGWDGAGMGAAGWYGGDISSDRTFPIARCFPLACLESGGSISVFAAAWTFVKKKNY